MVHFVDQDSNDLISAKLMYYQKLKKIHNVQPIRGDIYRVVIYYVKKDKPSIRYPMHFHVHVSDNGYITLLKERCAENIVVYHKHKKNRGFSTISRQTWSVPRIILDFFQEKQEMNKEKYKDITLNEAAAQLFKIIAGGCYMATDGIRVNVYKGSLCGVFNVAMERTAYFFKDREKTTTEKGNVKKIFHAARAHMRTLSDGRQVPIRMHFRGERDFKWNGYRVIVTVSGKHHMDVNDFSVAAVESAERNWDKDFMKMNELGKVIKKQVNADL